MTAFFSQQQGEEWELAEYAPRIFGEGECILENALTAFFSQQQGEEWDLAEYAPGILEKEEEEEDRRLRSNSQKCQGDSIQHRMCSDIYG